MFIVCFLFCRAYEVKIRAYSGSDPLELWVEYISWVEQCFPKHGLEGNLEVLLQKCFAALKDEERYKQDQRFVKLWIKFVSNDVLLCATFRIWILNFFSLFFRLKCKPMIDWSCTASYQVKV